VAGREPVVVQVSGTRPADLEDPVHVDCAGHTIDVTFREESGRFEVYEVAVIRIPWKDQKARPIIASNLRLPWAAIIQAARSWHALQVVSVAHEPLNEQDADELNPARREMKDLGFKGEPIEQVPAEETERIQAARRKLPAIVASLSDGTGRRGRPSTHDLNQVAALYREGWGLSNSPTKHVAEALGISRSAAAKQVSRARSAGVLEPAPKQGVAGLGGNQTGKRTREKKR
jgi:hypothetical protein